MATTPKAMKEVFGGMPRSRMALETGTHSPRVSRTHCENDPGTPKPRLPVQAIAKCGRPQMNRISEDGATVQRRLPSGSSRQITLYELPVRLKREYSFRIELWKFFYPLKAKAPPDSIESRTLVRTVHPRSPLGTPA